MSKILELYSELNEASKKGSRFIDECFIHDVYSDARPKKVIVDLGAYTGEFSFYCLPFAERIYAVEPDPIPFLLMEKYVKDFGFDKIISVHQLAIAESDGTRKMRLNGGGGSHLVDGNPRDDDVSEVKALSLKTFFDQNGIDHVDILKVDIESGEREVFNSPTFEETIRKVDYVIGEHSGFTLLERFGFKVTPQAESGVYVARRI